MQKANSGGARSSGRPTEDPLSDRGCMQKQNSPPLGGRRRRRTQPGLRTTISINSGEAIILRSPFGAFSSQESQIDSLQCVGKNSFRCAGQSFPSHYASSSAPIPGEYLTSQPERSFGLETRSEDPSVDVPLSIQGCLPNDSALHCSADMSSGPIDELRQMVRR
jgi:hypothetical protein